MKTARYTANCATAYSDLFLEMEIFALTSELKAQFFASLQYELETTHNING